MTKKRIAVFTSGWGGEFLQDTLAGIIELAHSMDIDVFSFINFSIRGDHDEINDPETNIFRLPDITSFDGVFLFANTFNRDWELEYLTSEVKKNNIPCISLEYPIDGIPYISSENYYGMHELVEHMVIQHECKDILYISGPKDHPEANERLKAFLDVINEHSITLADDAIAYGDWSKSYIPDILSAWYEKHEKYPEAVICANDIMAGAAYNYLRERGIAIPDTVKVTGYDRIRLTQTLNPPITSVTHDWNNMGTKAMESLIALMKGEALNEHITLMTKFIAGGSCGCEVNPKNINHSLNDSMALTNNVIEPIDLDSHFRHFYTSVRKADKRIDVHNSLSYLFEREHIIEGEEFKLCLVPEFFDMDENDDKLPTAGYSDFMELSCFLAKGHIASRRKLPLRDCIFESAEREREAGYYIYLPLYSEGKTYGFAMLSGPINAANENQYYIWTRHMNAALEQVRSNMRLTALWNALMRQSVTDQLTGVYNRHGCEKNIYEEMMLYGKEGRECALFLVDVDNMKVINDRLGHANGDKALTLVTRAMKESIPQELKIARFGGDEFLIGGRLDAALYSPDKIIEDIERQLEKFVSDDQFELPLTVSIGYSLCYPKHISDIEKAILLADENMYVTKKLHHS